MLSEKYNLERMASVNALAAQVIGATDPKKAADFVSRFIDCIFPEATVARERTMAEKLEELKEFSEKKISLQPIGGTEYFRLKVEEKK